jgi:hypothetical protein
MPEDAELKKELPPLAQRRVFLGEAAVEEVLKKIGKTKPEHELNCGSCGYIPAENKARAVLLGKGRLKNVPSVTEGEGGILFGQYHKQYAERDFGAQRIPAGAGRSTRRHAG